MRIGIDLTPLTRSRTGVGYFVYYQLQHAMRQAPDWAWLGLASGLAGVDLGGLPELAGVRRLAVPTRALYGVWSAIGAPRADRLLGGVDVFHATNYFLPPVAGARRVLSIYDLTFLRAPQLCSPRIVGPFARHVRRFALEADALIACSESTRRDIAELLGVDADRVTVAYGAVDPMFAPGDIDAARSRLNRGFGLRGPYFLFVSTLEPRKNVVGLLRAFARVARELPHTLVLAGRAGWGMEGLDAIIEELGLGARVRRIGYVRGHAALVDLYTAAEAFLFPSLYEGFGLPLLEAMACGCPVLTSRRASLPEVGGDAAVYVDPEDDAEMAAGIRRLAEDQALRADLRDRGVAQASRFTWEACARATVDAYRRAATCG